MGGWPEGRDFGQFLRWEMSPDLNQSRVATATISLGSSLGRTSSCVVFCRPSLFLLQMAPPTMEHPRNLMAVLRNMKKWFKSPVCLTVTLLPRTTHLLPVPLVELLPRTTHLLPVLLVPLALPACGILTIVEQRKKFIL